MPILLRRVANDEMASSPSPRSEFRLTRSSPCRHGQRSEAIAATHSAV
jgi:hypothetical protein